MREDDPMLRPCAQRDDAQPRLVASIAGSLAMLVILGLVAGRLAVGHAAVGAEAPRGEDELFQNGVETTTGIDRAWAEIDRSLAPAGGGYAWIDRRAGIVQVPIERAIDLVCLEQGAPAARKEPMQSP